MAGGWWRTWRAAWCQAVSTSYGGRARSRLAPPSYTTNRGLKLLRSRPLSQPVPNFRVSPKGCTPSLFSGNLRIKAEPSSAGQTARQDSNFGNAGLAIRSVVRRCDRSHLADTTEANMTDTFSPLQAPLQLSQHLASIVAAISLGCRGSRPRPHPVE